MTKESQQYKHTDSDVMKLRELFLKIIEWWQYLLSKWVIILICGLLGASLGFFYATTRTAVYTATTTFVLEDEKAAGGGLGSLAGLASVAGVDVGSSGGIFQGDNILELYKSRKMIVQTLFTPVENGRGELLIGRYIGFNALRKQWIKRPELANLKFELDSGANGSASLKVSRLRDSILNGIVADITKNYLMVSKPDKKLSIIKVDVKSKDETFAKAFNDALVSNVNNYYMQTKTKKAQLNVKIIQQKTDSVRSVMNGAIYTAVAVADATPNLNPTRQVQRVAPAQKAQFSAETNKAVLSSLLQNLEMSKVSLMKETPLLEVVDRPVYPLTKEKFGKIKGLILGGFLFGFFTVAILMLKRMFRIILN